MGAPVETLPPPERRVFRVTDLKRPLARQVFDPKKYAALKADIAANGLLEPPHVSPDGRVASGNMRVAVLLDLGVETAECEVYPHLTTFDALLRHAQRCDIKSDVSSYDLARRLLLYRKEYPDASQKDISGLFDTSEATVSRRVQMLALPNDLLAMVLAGQGPLNLAHVAAVAKCDLQVKEAKLREAVKVGWTAKELAKAVKPKRGAKAKTETVPYEQTVFTYPRGWSFDQVDAALNALRDYLRKRVKGLNAKALPLGVLPKGVDS